MTTTNQKTVWGRVSELAVTAWRKNRPTSSGTSPRPSPQSGEGVKLPELDVELNDKTLATLRDDDPAQRAWLSCAQTHIERNLRSAFDATLPVEKQAEFWQRAAAVTALVEDFESARARCREELQERQKREQKK